MWNFCIWTSVTVTFRTGPFPLGMEWGEFCWCTGLQLYWTGRWVNYPLLALSWALFEPKWTSVSTVTVTQARQQQPSMTHIPALNHNTHIPGSTLAYRNYAQCFHSARLCLCQTWGGNGWGREREVEKEAKKSTFSCLLPISLLCVHIFLTCCLNWCMNFFTLLH